MNIVRGLGLIGRLGLTGACLMVALAVSTPGIAQEVTAKSANPELEACKTTGLIALKERSPTLKDILIDPDAVTIAKADTKVEDTPIRTIVMGDAYLERGKTDKPYRFLCLIGEKGKIVLTFFTQQ